MRTKIVRSRLSIGVSLLRRYILPLLSWPRKSGNHPPFRLFPFATIRHSAPDGKALAATSRNVRRIAGCSASRSIQLSGTYAWQPSSLDVSLTIHVYDLAHDLQVTPMDRLLDPRFLATQEAAIHALLAPRLQVSPDGRSHRSPVVAIGSASGTTIRPISSAVSGSLATWSHFNNDRAVSLRFESPRPSSTCTSRIPIPSR
jgi:hypothetical protein